MGTDWKLYTPEDHPSIKRWINLRWVMMIQANGKGGAVLYLHDGSRIEVNEPPDP